MCNFVVNKAPTEGLASLGAMTSVYKDENERVLCLYRGTALKRLMTYVFTASRHKGLQVWQAVGEISGWKVYEISWIVIVWVNYIKLFYERFWYVTSGP